MLVGKAQEADVQIKRQRREVQLDTVDQKRTKQQGKTNNIFAGDLNIVNDPIRQNKEVAQKRAMKLVKTQFDEDVKSYGRVDSYLAQKDVLLEEAKEAQSEISRLNTLEDEAREAYGVSKDSQEYKELQILRKSKKIDEVLTGEEQQILDNMGSLTEYQKDGLEYDAMRSHFQVVADDALEGAENASKSAEAAKKALSIDTPMVGVQKEAAEIIEEARQEEIAGLLNEAKDNIDEKMKEEEEKIKEATEKKEKEKEELKKKEDIKIEESSTVKKNTSSNPVKVDQELKGILRDNKVLGEDLKGIKINKKMYEYSL